MDETDQSNVETYVPKAVINQAQKVKEKMDQSVARFERRNRVTNVTIILMVSVAGLYELTEFLLDLIPFVGWIFSGLVGIFAWLTFYTWTSIKGWRMADTLAKFFISKILPALGMIPLLNIGPELIVSVLLTILIVKSEDYIYNKTKGRADAETIVEGVQFFNLLRDVYKE